MSSAARHQTKYTRFPEFTGASRLRRLVRHDDRAGSGEHVAHTMADRDLGAGDLGWDGAAHLAHALLQRVNRVYAGMYAGKTASIGVERQLAAGEQCSAGDEGHGFAVRQ